MGSIFISISFYNLGLTTSFLILNPMFPEYSGRGPPGVGLGPAWTLEAPLGRPTEGVEAEECTHGLAGDWHCSTVSCDVISS